MKSSYPVDNFLKRAAIDSHLFPSHIILFISIFYYSPEKNPKGFFQVSRRKLMQFSRIKSKTTYHKCIADLVHFKYITYEPSFDPYLASKVSLTVVEDQVE